MRDYNAFFTDISEGKIPYAYQQRVAQLLFEGKNVIVCVGTGAGKTCAATFPFLYAREKNLITFPQKMIYSLPTRTLTNSIFDDLQLLKRITGVTSIQTGEFPDDRYFDKDIIISTIDQTLSSFSGFPLSLSKTQANMNVGAFIGSYLVFDEFHLLDPRRAMATTLGMIEKLKDISRVCIMTATLTDGYIHFLKEKFGFECVRLTDFPDDIKNIRSLKLPVGMKAKRSATFCEGKKIGAKDIIGKHKNRSIVVCNKVETVQLLYNDLKEQTREMNTTILCIHSRYFDRDRRIKEKLITTYFGEGSDKQDVILVATQVIEVGMNISCDVMHVEISPLNIYIQRIGRCARFEGEYGDVYVYDVLDVREREKIMLVSENKEEQDEIRLLNSKYLPYEKATCEKMLECLKLFPGIDEGDLLKMINYAMADSERKNIKDIQALGYRKKEIQKGWKSGNKGLFRQTIRDIQSVDIILFDLEGYKGQCVMPWLYETISVYKWRFIGWAKKIEKLVAGNWVLAKAVTIKEYESEKDERYSLEYLKYEELRECYEPIFVDYRYVDYSDAGLRFEVSDNRVLSSLKKFVSEENLNYCLKKDTFLQHCKALAACYRIEFKPKMNYLYSRLDILWGEKIDWERLIILVLYMHDFGKLNKKWQYIMQGFQRMKNDSDIKYTYRVGELLAHSDYDARFDSDLAKKCAVYTKPKHAGIGALALYNLLLDSNYSEELALVASVAIQKHHNIATTTCDSFVINEAGIKEIKVLLESIGFEGDILSSGNDSVLNDTFDEDRQWLLYYIIVRILRFCDQRATENIGKYISL